VRTRRVRPHPAAVARALAGENGATWRRLVYEPVTGYALDYGTTTYRPPVALRRYLQTRDPHQPLSRLDHPCRSLRHRPRDPAPQGPTSAANTGPLNRPEHRLKTFASWAIDSHADGSARWTSPSGHTYWYHRMTTDPTPRDPGHQPTPATPPRLMPALVAPAHPMPGRPFRHPGTLRQPDDGLKRDDGWRPNEPCFVERRSTDPALPIDNPRPSRPRVDPLPEDPPF
jgi:hypothetical protein